MSVVLELPVGKIMSRLSRGEDILRKRLEAPSAVVINSRQISSPTRWQGSLVATIA